MDYTVFYFMFGSLTILSGTYIYFVVKSKKNIIENNNKMLFTEV